HRKLSSITSFNGVWKNITQPNLNFNVTIQSRFFATSLPRSFSPSSVNFDIPFTHDEDINHAYIKFVNLEGMLEGIRPLKEVLKSFDRNEYWLVEVDSHSNPPVCKLLSKRTYFKKRKELKSKPNIPKPNTKELQIHWKVEEHDLNHMIKRTKGWLMKGYNVSITISYKGLQKKKWEQNKSILDKIYNELKQCPGDMKEPRWLGTTVFIDIMGDRSTKRVEEEETLKRRDKERDRDFY
ncbi:2563_t:CDS:1, partial [Acaulospora morrowiae]